jgi:ABC-2 type transport system ATP-binding protein
MHAISAHGLTKTFKGKIAVDHIDLTVDEGDVVGLLGPNGAGKTTTIMMLLGITLPNEGTIDILGHRYPKARSKAVERTNFWASYLGLPGKLTVREILDVHCDLYGAPKSRKDEVIGRFGIEELLPRFPMSMSSGQKTLVGLARSLLNKPRLLFLDEPTASLDPEIADRIRRALAAAHREYELTMLITSHNMADIERLCRRVVFIGGGRIVADGSPSDITSHYQVHDLEAAFLSIAEEARA